MGRQRISGRTVWILIAMAVTAYVALAVSAGLAPQQAYAASGERALQASGSLQVNIQEGVLDVVAKDVVWTGKVVKPKVTVKYGSRKLKAGRDYKITYPKSKKAGTYKVKVTGKGKYAGMQADFPYYRVLPHKRVIKSARRSGKNLKLSWNTYPDGTDYYVIACSSSASGLKEKVFTYVFADPCKGGRLHDYGEGKWDSGALVENSYLKKKWGAGHISINIGKYLGKSYKKKYVYVCLMAVKFGDTLLDDDYGVSKATVKKVYL